jgi:putative peptidoglycan lipid II flippase
MKNKLNKLDYPMHEDLSRDFEGHPNIRVTKTAGLLGGITFCSRILGYLRDMMLAGFFGAGFFADVFITAFRIPNLCRRLFSEGAFTMAFIPVFSRYLQQTGPAEAYTFAARTFRFTALFLGAGVLLGLIGAPLVVGTIAPGFIAVPDKFEQAVRLLRIMLPYVYCIGLAGVCMGVLNVLDHFATPALAPILLNLSMIAAMLGASRVSSDMTVRIAVLALAVVTGGGMQLGLQLAVLMKKGVNLLRGNGLFHPGIRQVGAMILPTLFSASVFQLNVFFDTLLASLLAEGAISYLYFADRMVQFPLGIFAVSIATAVFPTAARQAAMRDLPALRDTLSHGLSLSFFVSLPSMAGLIVLREPIVGMLFERGAFDLHMTRLTASALLYYGIGIWAFSAIRVTLPVLFALNETRAPVRAGLLSVGAHMLLGLLLMRPMSFDGLALATSLSSMLNLWLLLRVATHRIGGRGAAAVAQSVGRSLFCTAAMGLVIWMILPAGNDGSLMLAMRVGACVLTGVLVYTLLSYAVNRETFLRAVAVFR